MFKFSLSAEHGAFNSSVERTLMKNEQEEIELPIESSNNQNLSVKKQHLNTSLKYKDLHQKMEPIECKEETEFTLTEIKMYDQMISLFLCKISHQNPGIDK